MSLNLNLPDFRYFNLGVIVQISELIVIIAM